MKVKTLLFILCVQFYIQAVYAMPYKEVVQALPQNANNTASNIEYIRKLESRQAMLKQQYNQLLQEQKINDKQAAGVGAMASRKYVNQSLQIAKQMSQVKNEIDAIDKTLIGLKGADGYGEPAHKKSSSPTGSVECSKCHGSGRCTHCAGRGEKRGKTTIYDCSWCKGTGRCEICNGKGKRFYNRGYR